MTKKKSTKSIREFHALGKSVLKATVQRERRRAGVWGLFDEFGAETAAEKNRLQEARHFARLYDSQQLAWLCGLGRDVGRPLSRSHVLVLVRLADRRQRDRLALKCAKEAWSVRKLELEVRRIGPRRRYGGRSPSRPESVEKSLIVTEQIADRWIRWVRVLTSTEEDPKHHGANWDELPKPIRTRLTAISEEAERLRDACRKELHHP